MQHRSLLYALSVFKFTERTTAFLCSEDTPRLRTTRKPRHRKAEF